MGAKILLVAILVVAAAAPARAMVFDDTNSQTKMYLVPNSGSHIGLTAGDVKIRDIKGYPFGGPFISGDIRIEPGFGSFTVPGGDVLKDTGWIQKTTIERVGNDLKISWDYDPAKGPIGVTIFEREGSGLGFEKDITTFISKADVPSGTKNIIRSGKAADNINYYYRVIPTKLPYDDIFSDEKNCITVGKFVAKIGRGMNWTSFPLDPQASKNSLDEFVGNTLPNNTYVYYKPAAGSPATLMAALIKSHWLDASTLNDSTPSPSSIKVSLERGFWVDTATTGQAADINLAVVGRVPNEDLAVLIGVGGITNFGTIYPKYVSLADSSLITSGAELDDKIYFKPNAGSAATNMAVIKGGRWINADNVNDANPPEPNFGLQPGFGLIYDNSTGLAVNWQRIKPWQ